MSQESETLMPEIRTILERMRKTMFGFGYYDPETPRDVELYRLLKPDFDALTAHAATLEQHAARLEEENGRLRGQVEFLSGHAHDRYCTCHKD